MAGDMQAAAEPVRLRLERQQIHIAGASDTSDTSGASDTDALLAAVTAQLSSNPQTPRAIIVNIGPLGAERLVLFCSANLGASIAQARTVVVDVAADTAYRAFARSMVAAAVRAVGGLRDVLRTAPVASVGVQCAQVCQQLDAIALMAEGYALQRTNSEVASAASALAAAVRLLRESAGVHEDNVRCMDDLQYEATPALAAIDRCFR